MKGNSLQRYMYPSGSEIWLDSNGLLVSPSGSLWYKKLKDLAHIAKLPGGILLAEGGMGKTTLMEQLRDSLKDRPVHLLKLGEYVADPVGFRTDLETSLAASAESRTQTVIFDGLDEAPELAGVILRKLRQLPKSISVWISSRDVAAIRAIQSEFPELDSYNLAPLMKNDLRALATQVGVDGDEFLDAATRQGVLPICAKPLGCELALSVFRENGLVGVAQRDLWQRGIERLFDETPSPTRQIASTQQFTLDEILHCSAWISLCLALSENHFVWSGEQSHCPKQSIGISDMASTRFSAVLILTTLRRGVFSPLGDGRIAFAHALYGDYLAALGFATSIPAEHWTSLLLNSQRNAIFPQRAGIAAWLATYNTEFFAKLSTIQPELLLASTDSVQALGPDKLCAALLDRASGLSHRQRQSVPIRSNLHRLKDDRTPPMLRDCLLDAGAGTAAIELATAIAEACEYTELSGVLAARVLDENLNLRERVHAGYAVCRLDDEDAKSRLKRLLPIDPATDPEDNLRGIVLRACWPSHLPPDELTVHLIKPQKSNYIGAYSNFLKYDLPESLESSIDENSAVVFLNWALPHINEDEPYDALGRLARNIYTICWKWTGNPAVVELLASGYVAAHSECRSPFLQKLYEDESITSHILTREAVLKDVDRRLAVLETVLSCCEIDPVDLAHIPFNDYPLYTQNDLPLLFERVFADPSGSLSEKWAICIKAVVFREGLEAHADQFDRLHKLHPDLIDDSRKRLADMDTAAKLYTELIQKRKKKESDRKREPADDQKQIDKLIKKLLGTPDLPPKSFEGVSSLLNSKNGKRLIGEIDIQLTPGWAKLTKEERSAMLEIAQSYLTQADIQPTPPGQHQYSVARALTTLRLLKPGVYVGLSRDVWQKCGVELLKAAINDKMELLDPLFDTLSEQYPDVATYALLEVLSQELKGSFISIIRHWGSRLSDSQAEAILAIADDSATDPGRHFLLIDNLARHGKKGLVRGHLDTLFSGGWGVPPEPEFHKLRRLAFVLNPASYIRQLLDVFSDDPAWGREWIESSIDAHDYAFQDALLSCDATDVAEMYIWLHGQYPAETFPEHEGGYTSGILDEIHMLKNHLINHLTESGRDGSVTALERIFRSFPADGWLRDCILDARAAEQTTTVSVLTVTQIKELYEQKQALRCSVNSSQDLLDLIMTSIEGYRTYLQGDTPAVGDLWNTQDPIRPRDEEYLSDHLKRYLDLRLTTHVVINREVQVRRKLFKDGDSGSRTDIWIQAPGEDGSVLTLCIEVKCNWNRSANDALKDQLIRKYMSGGTATAGILLLGWFECSSWDSSDSRLAASTATWPDSDAALNDLQEQADREQEAGNSVRAVVIDCALR